MITQEELVENDVIVAELAENDIVSADVGAVSVATAGVSSWNGQKGDVTYTAPVTSVNGQTGDVVISSLDTYTKTETDNLLAAKANSSDLASVATTGNYNDLSNKPTIPTVPTKVSAFQNDAGYITEAPVRSVNGQTGDVVIPAVDAYTKQETDALLSAKANDADLAGVAKSGNYNDLSNKPTIPTVPTKVSAFQNDAGYLTQHQSLDGYATEQWVGAQGYLTAAPVTSVNGQTGDVELSIPTVPTNVSAFNNDAGYLTLSDLPIYGGGVE